jgi:hypothetical protein
MSRYYSEFGVITKSNKYKTNAHFEWLLCAKLQVVNVPAHGSAYPNTSVIKIK